MSIAGERANRQRMFDHLRSAALHLQVAIADLDAASGIGTTVGFIEVPWDMARRVGREVDFHAHEIAESVKHDHAGVEELLDRVEALIRALGS